MKLLLVVACSWSASGLILSSSPQKLLAKHVTIIDAHHSGSGAVAAADGGAHKHKHKGTFVRTFSLDWEAPQEGAEAEVAKEEKVMGDAESVREFKGNRTNASELDATYVNASQVNVTKSLASANVSHRGNVSKAGNASVTTTTTPAPPEAGRVYEVDATPDPHKAWRCIEVRASKIKGAGRGLFATCAIHNNTLLGEYRGYRFLMGEHGANKRLEADWAYIWKVPRCLAPLTSPVVITRMDKVTAHKCSNAHQYVYVDAKPMDKPLENPMRFVNGVKWTGKHRDTGVKQNVDGFFADDRVWYYSNAEVAIGDELIVDYGPGYWKDDSDDDDENADWGSFVTDS